MEKNKLKIVELFEVNYFMRYFYVIIGIMREALGRINGEQLIDEFGKSFFLTFRCSFCT